MIRSAARDTDFLSFLVSAWASGFEFPVHRARDHGRGLVRMVLPLLVLVQVTSIGDIGALRAVSSKQRCGAAGCALAVYACSGYVMAFPVVAGIALDWFGDAGRPEAWSAAFAATVLGSAVAGPAVAAVRPHEHRA